MRQKGKHFEQRMLRVLRYVQDHLDENHSTASLAEIACLSRFHFHRLFRAVMGETLKEHVRRLRLERAAQSLRGGASVTEAAFAACYGSVEAFTRAFRHAYHVPPSSFIARPGIPWAIRGACSIHYGDEPWKTSGFLHIPEVMTMDFRTETLPAMSYAALRHIGPYQDLYVAFNQLFEWIGENPEKVDPSYMLSLYWNSPENTPEDKLQTDCCVGLCKVPEGWVGDPDKGLTRLDMPERKYAVYRHVGPYEELSAVWSRVMRESVAAGDVALADAPPFDRYVNSPADTPKEKLITDIYLPLAGGS